MFVSQLYAAWPHLIVKEVDGMFVQSEGECLEEGDVVGHHLLVGEVELIFLRSSWVSLSSRNAGKFQYDVQDVLDTLYN